MKKYLFCALALLVALTVGCGRRGSVNQTGNKNIEVHHDHTGHTHADGTECTGDHGHSHDTHAGHSHESHSHGEGECCGHDHKVEAHSGHNHNHVKEAHAGHVHDHSGHSHAAGEACGHDHSHKGHSHDAHADHDHHNHTGHLHEDHSHGEGEEARDEIVFPAAQAARTDFEVQAARKGEFRETIKCGGQVSAAQGAVSVVTAPVSGVVTFVDGRIMASSPVGKGQKLFYISSGSLASGDAALKARVAFEQAEVDFERAERLYKDKIISQSDYTAARSAFLTAQSEYEPVKNMNDDGSITVFAPAAGYLSQLSVAPGDYVEMGQPLATVARAGRMQLKAMVSQRYFDRLDRVDDANFCLPSSEKYLNVKSMNGSLYSVGRIVSQGSTLVPVVFEFDGNVTIPDGTYVDVSLLGARRDGVITLPLTAITEQQGLYYVYVQLDAEHYSRREVTLGGDDGIRVEILSGVGPGDRIVTRGAVNVRMAAASGAIPHGHTH